MTYRIKTDLFVHCRRISDLDFLAANTTPKKRATRWLEYRFLALIHAGCTKVVVWLSVVHPWLHRISISSKREVVS